LPRSKLLFIILSLCLALVLVYLVMSYFNQQRTQNRLSEQISTTTQTLAMIAEPARDLKQRLDQAKVENQAAQQSVSVSNMDTTGVLNLLLKTADERNLTVDPLSTEQWEKNSIGAGTYRMLPIELIINGKQADFILFIADLENRQIFPSLAIQDMTVTNSSPSGSGAEAGITAKLTLALVVRSDVVS
jgi:hypothetical protein